MLMLSWVLVGEGSYSCVVVGQNPVAAIFYHARAESRDSGSSSSVRSSRRSGLDHWPRSHATRDRLWTTSGQKKRRGFQTHHQEASSSARKQWGARLTELVVSSLDHGKCNREGGWPSGPMKDTILGAASKVARSTKSHERKPGQTFTE